MTVIAALSTGCSVISGNQLLPVKESDRSVITKAMSSINNAPNINASIDDNSFRIYSVAFDGTLNDRSRVLAPDDERQTIIGRISTIVHADYYRGVGMHGDSINYIDAATGGSSTSTANQAKEKLLKQAEEWIKDDPRAEIRVFVTGFSRGAATARHFMNIVEAEWGKRDQVARMSGQRLPSLRFYALLYDTVATGQQKNLQLQLPKSVDYLVHFIAINEPRSALFTPIVDVESDLGVRGAFESLTYAFLPNRINEVYLPGAHSDVGASYLEGVGDLYITMTERILYLMGLSNTNCWDKGKDPLMGGKHDPRGVLDALFGSLEPDGVSAISRRKVEKSTVKLNDEERFQMANRLKLMSMANFERMSGEYSAVKSHPSYRFEFRKIDGEIKPVNVSEFIDISSVKFARNEKGGTVFEFRSPAKYGGKASNLILSDRTMSHIYQDDNAIVDLTFMEKKGDVFLAVFVNERKPDLIFLGKNTEASQDENMHVCKKDANGNGRSPIQVFVIP